MKQSFKFEQIGKRTPYTVPDGFFSQMEEDLWKRISEKPHKNKTKFFYMRIVLAIATVAAAMLFFVFNADSHRKTEKSNDLAKIDKAFSNLDTNDQAYLIDIYQNDIFLNDN